MSEIPFDVPGGWTRRSVALGDRSVELLMPTDPDHVLETQLESEHGVDESPDPYWAALWSSALPTAEAVLRASWRSDESALELGCGMGLVGLAALLNGMQVTFSDRVDQAVQLALDNARRNGFTHAQGLQLDWKQPPMTDPPNQYSTILASDILYDRVNHGPILDTIERLLARDGVCWIGDPGRYNSREFLDVASQRFRVQLRDRDGASLTVPQSGQYQMFVLER